MGEIKEQVFEALLQDWKASEYRSSDPEVDRAKTEREVIKWRGRWALAGEEAGDDFPEAAWEVWWKNSGCIDSGSSIEGKRAARWGYARRSEEEDMPEITGHIDPDSGGVVFEEKTVEEAEPARCPHLKISYSTRLERANGMEWEGDYWACDECGVQFMSCEWRVMETTLTTPEHPELVPDDFPEEAWNEWWGKQEGTTRLEDGARWGYARRSEEAKTALTAFSDTWKRMTVAEAERDDGAKRIDSLNDMLADYGEKLVEAETARDAALEEALIAQRASVEAKDECNAAQKRVELLEPRVQEYDRMIPRYQAAMGDANKWLHERDAALERVKELEGEPTREWYEKRCAWYARRLEELKRERDISDGALAHGVVKTSTECDTLRTEIAELKAENSKMLARLTMDDEVCIAGWKDTEASLAEAVEFLRGYTGVRGMAVTAFLAKQEGK